MRDIAHKLTLQLVDNSDRTVYELHISTKARICQVMPLAKRVCASNGPSADAEGEGGVVGRDGHATTVPTLYRLDTAESSSRNTSIQMRSEVASRSIKQRLLGKKPPTEISRYEGNVVEIRLYGRRS